MEKITLNDIQILEKHFGELTSAELVIQYSTHHNKSHARVVVAHWEKSIDLEAEYQEPHWYHDMFWYGKKGIVIMRKFFTTDAINYLTSKPLTINGEDYDPMIRFGAELVDPCR